LVTRVNPKQVKSFDDNKNLKDRLTEISVIKGKVGTKDNLPTLTDGLVALYYVEDEMTFYTWKGSVTGWETIKVQTEGMNAAQKALVGDNIFDSTKISSTSSLDGRLKTLTDEVIMARGTMPSLSERLNAMEGSVEQSAVMIDEHNRYFKDYFFDAKYMDIVTSTNIVIQGGYLSATKGRKIEDLFEDFSMVDTTNSHQISTDSASEVSLDPDYTDGFMLTDTFDTVGTKNAVITVDEVKPSSYDWGQIKQAYNATTGYHMFEISTCIDKNDRRWVFYRDSWNYISFFILNPDGTLQRGHTNAYTSGASYNPRCAVMHDGSIRLIFSNSSSGYIDMGFNPDGSVRHGAVSLWGMSSNPAVSRADIVVDGEGKVWYFMGNNNTVSAANTVGNLYCYVRNPNHSLYGTAWIDCPSTEGQRIRPSAAVDANGRVWVTFFNARPSSYPNNTASIEMWTQIFNPNMTVYKAPFRANNTNFIRHWNDVSAVMVATPTEMELFYNEGTAVFFQRFNLAGGYLNSTYAATKHYYQLFGTGDTYSYTQDLSTFRGFRFTVMRDCVFQGYSGILHWNTASYTKQVEFILMKKEQNGWVRLDNQYHSYDTDGTWNYPSANKQIILKEGEQYAVMVRPSNGYARLWFDEDPPAWRNNQYGPIRYDHQCYASTTSVESIYDWGYALNGIGLLLTDCYGAYDTTGEITNMYDGAIYDSVDDRTYVAYPSSYERMSAEDIYVSHADKIGYGKPINLTRISQTGNHADSHPTLSRDYNNQQIILDWSGVNAAYTSTYWQAYTAILKMTPSEIKYFLSNDDGMNWREVKPGEPYTFPTANNKLRMKVEFWSPKAGVVPRLRGYSIAEWNELSGEVIGEFASEQLPSTAPITRATLNVNHALNGGDIEYFLSNDGGFTWKPAPPGKSVPFENPDSSDLRVKAVITVPAGTNLSPILYDYAVTSTSVPTFDQVRKLQVNLANMMFDMNMAGILSKSNLRDTVADTFEDTTGINLAKSYGLAHDAGRGLFSLNTLKYPLHSDGSVAASSIGAYNATNYEVSNILDNNLSNNYTDNSYWLAQISSVWDGRVEGRAGAELDITFPDMREVGNVDLFMYTNSDTHGYCDHQIEAYNPGTAAWEVIVPKVTLANPKDLGPRGDGWWKYPVSIPYKTNKIRVRVWATTSYGTMTEVQVSPPVATEGELRSLSVAASQNVISAMLVTNDKRPSGSTLAYQMTNNYGEVSAQHEFLNGDGTNQLTVTNAPIHTLKDVTLYKNITEDVVRTTETFDALAYNNVASVSKVSVVRADAQSFAGGNGGLVLNLSRANIVKSSVVVEADMTRDGLITTRTLLVQDVDYTVDEVNGRITMAVATDTTADSIMVNYNYVTTFIAGTDYTVNGSLIEWTGTQVTAGETYQVNYTYKEALVVGTDVTVVNADNSVIEFVTAPEVGTGNVEINYDQDMTSWQDVSPEMQFTFSTVGSQLAARAIVKKGTAIESPELSAWGWMW
jgi:hypothetical protein